MVEIVLSVEDWLTMKNSLPIWKMGFQLPTPRATIAPNPILVAIGRLT